MQAVLLRLTEQEIRALRADVARNKFVIGPPAPHEAALARALQEDSIGEANFAGRLTNRIHSAIRKNEIKSYFDLQTIICNTLESNGRPQP